MRIFLSVLILLASLTGCTPQRLQSVTLTEGKDGQEAYRMSGYTDLGEVASGSSHRHITEALSEACPAGVTMLQVNETPTNNGLGDFLFWEAVAQCK